MVNAEVKQPIRANLSISISGEPKTGKSFLALTFPPPIVVFSFDIGLEPILLNFKGKEVSVITYPIPIVETVRAVGMKKDILDIWNKFNEDYRKATEDRKVKTIVIDTATALYEICRIGRTGELGRELDPTEYGDVFLRMKALIQRARISGQNLVLTHYLKEIYGDDRRPTGEVKLDGWKGTESEVDAALRTRMDSRMEAGKRKNFIMTTIHKSRYDGLKTTGLEVENMDYEKLCICLGVS